ncbi:MAG: hypothetical protein ABL958_15840 [Bdellovibrionia bacterium]
MKQVFMNVHIHEFSHPSPGEPAWKDKIARWSQLDFAAFGLVEAYESLKAGLSRPSFIVLASPGASNETDRKFAIGGGASPSLFVHTLPNIRCSPLLQVMEWSGPVLCVQNDPQTFVAGVREAFSFVGAEHPVVWVVAVEYRAFDPHGAFILELNERDGDFVIVEDIKGLRGGNEAADKDWLGWLETGAGDFELPGGLSAREHG